MNNLTQRIESPASRFLLKNCSNFDFNQLDGSLSQLRSHIENSYNLHLSRPQASLFFNPSNLDTDNHCFLGFEVIGQEGKILSGIEELEKGPIEQDFLLVDMSSMIWVRKNNFGEYYRQCSSAEFSKSVFKFLDKLHNKEYSNGLSARLFLDFHSQSSQLSLPDVFLELRDKSLVDINNSGTQLVKLNHHEWRWIISDRRGRGGKKTGPRVNNDIKCSEVRLIGESDQCAIASIDKAKSIASDLGLDLVEASPSAKPPVVKLIDYGKFKYQQQKKASDAKKKQVVVSLKEIQFRPNIEKHDLDVKLKKAERFLAQGDKIKMIMQFRGREMAYSQMGMEKFKGIIAQVVEFGGTVEADPKMNGNRIITIIAASRKK